MQRSKKARARAIHVRKQIYFSTTDSDDHKPLKRSKREKMQPDLQNTKWEQHSSVLRHELASLEQTNDQNALHSEFEKILQEMKNNLFTKKPTSITRPATPKEEQMKTLLQQLLLKDDAENYEEEKNAVSVALLEQ